MIARRTKNCAVMVGLVCATLMPKAVLAQRTMGGAIPGSDQGILRVTEHLASIEVYLKGPNGEALARSAVVTLTKLNGQSYREVTTRAGHLRMDEIPPTEYNMRVVAPGFLTVTKQIDANGKKELKLTIQLEPTAEGIDAISDREMAILGPKAQKALGKAIEALRANKPGDARGPLEKVHQMAPQSAEVQYLYGVYELRQNDGVKAKAYWAKTLEIDPQHYRALISICEELLHENKAADAMPYLERAVKAEPTAWRPHALYAEAYLRQGWPEEAIREAERAQELGHAKAVVVQPVLAAALFKQGQGERATVILQAYVNAHPADTEAKKQLTALQAPREGGSASSGATESATVAGEILDVLPSSWLPSDIDERVGAVEAGTVCPLDDVLQKTGGRIQEFLHNVDRFTATESMQHESINKWGMAAARINRAFEYVVAVEELKSGFFNVEEYRSSANGANEFPDGIASNGLPAMILILHPHNVVNFDIACEGLSRWNDKPAWQVHFRQRSDRPNTIRRYRVGLQGLSYPIDLKGRAWIAADTFQVVRMETQMISPVREINLAADYTAIEYGPVHFNKRNVEMWLPQTAEVYSDWRGKRFHRSHSFSNYMLFAVDEKQNIAAPKATAEAAPKTDGETERPNP